MLSPIDWHNDDTLNDTLQMNCVSFETGYYAFPLIHNQYRSTEICHEFYFIYSKN